MKGSNNHVDIDWEKKGYSVTLDGAEVARDSATFCSLAEDRIAMYSIADGPLTATLPAGWNPQEVLDKRFCWCFLGKEFCSSLV